MGQQVDSEYREQTDNNLRKMKVAWGPIGEPVYKRSYQQKMQNGEPEGWADTVIRAVDGNLSLVDPKFIEPGEREKLLNLIFNFYMLPAGRHLSSSGMKGRQFVFNCHAAGWDAQDPSAHFNFTFDQLMQGGGVGSNYSNRYLDLQPIVKNKVELVIVCRPDHPNIEEFRERVETRSANDLPLFNTLEDSPMTGRVIDLGEHPENYFTVPDSREGWVESVDFILKAAYGLKSNDPIKMHIDVSFIRERGAPLKTSGGIACGPEPLVSMLLKFASQLNQIVGRKMNSFEAMTLDHTLASCVVAGGKRRSSRMSVKNWKDFDIFTFLACKKNDHDHWTTNISVEIDDEFIAAVNFKDPHALAVLDAVVNGKCKNGEPGFWNRSLSMRGERNPENIFCPNPCGEIAMWMWENCNLGHINLRMFASRPAREAKEAFRLMTRWLVRATFSDIPNPRQRAVVDRNRRIGVGFFGFHGWLALQGIKYSDAPGNPVVIKNLESWYVIVDNEALSYSQLLGIPTPIKNTCLAPTGSIACLSGDETSAQCMFAPRMKRRVRVSNMDTERISDALKKGVTIYPDPDADQTTILEFWVESPLVQHVRNAGFDPDEILEGQDEISVETSLKVQAMLQKHWSDNAISFTINLPKEKMEDKKALADMLIEFLPQLKGTTMFPEGSRENMPLERVTKEQWDAYTGPKEIAQVEDICKGGCPV